MLDKFVKFFSANILWRIPTLFLFCHRWFNGLLKEYLYAFISPTHGRAKAGRPARTYIQQLCEDTGCCPEDLPGAMNDREKWRERVRDIRAPSTTWWWWWNITDPLEQYLWLQAVSMIRSCKIIGNLVLRLEFYQHFCIKYCSPILTTFLSVTIVVRQNEIT